MAGLTTDRCGFVCREVTVELVRVLARACRYSRDRMATVLDELISTEELVLEAPGYLVRAARGYRQGRADFSDPMISAAARRSGGLHLHTFDRRTARLEGAELVGAPGDRVEAGDTASAAWPPGG